MTIFYNLYTGYYGEDEAGVLKFPEEYAEEDINVYLSEIAFVHAVGCGRFDDEDADIELYWREATKKDLELYEIEEV